MLLYCLMLITPTANRFIHYVEYKKMLQNVGTTLHELSLYQIR